ncbi:glycosyltransferase family 2 protein [Geomonas sp. RF6]|uniref:glycosyltransferase family 2 protein n=1 Tax=Geomonas sp. RF6 TaxID=2897342 RepID=UPI001E6413B8|nr:glycosyltransferase family 2 protein [Geomonas sp. RF6]UFS69124.1 glycosyltransferase family 2 protein [Geomonas sp. RF6]
MTFTEAAILFLLLLLAYIYLGYPLLLCVLARLFPQPHTFDPGYIPSVTLVISAYNEAGVIGTKIENSLQLDYPPEKLSIVVVSDCSDDGTDEKVLAYAPRGVLLYRAEGHRGKTAALNGAMRHVSSEIVVFSDGNAIYDRGAIRALVRHFSDERVGYVVGHARYQEETRTAAGKSEGAYWDLEIMVKKWESAFSSVVGGDGAIYAIRRFLYRPMQETDINDFVNPLQIIVQGYRGIFDPEAFCTEHPAGRFDKEFSRKVRIVNRSFNGLFRVAQALLPWATGRFAWQLVSHKALRWFSPFFLALLFCAILLECLARPASLAVQGVAACCVTFCTLAALGWGISRKREPHPLFYLPYYFMLVNLASAKGIVLRLRGDTISTWKTVRHDEQVDAMPAAARTPLLLLPPLGVLVLAVWGAGEVRVLTLTAFLLTLFLGHALLFYPMLLLPLNRLWGKRIARDDSYTPEVTLLIVAYNEESVIEEKVLNTLALEYPKERLRVVVASDGSTDGTNAVVAGFARKGVELLAFAENRGKVAALNEAMERIDSEIVVFSDANVWYAPGAIRKLVRNFSDPRVGAVSGKVILANDALSYGVAEKSYYCIEHTIQEREGALGVLVGGDGAMYAIRRELFTPPSPDTILDDFVIPMAIARQGHLVVHEKEALGFEENLMEAGGEFRRKARIIAGGYQCLLRPGMIPRLSQPLLLFCFISHKLLRWGSGLLFLALVSVLVQLQVLHPETATPVLAWLLTGAGGAAFLALLVQLVPPLKRWSLANHCHYFFLLLAASLVGCYLGTTGRQRVNWRSEVA